MSIYQETSPNISLKSTVLMLFVKLKHLWCNRDKTTFIEAHKLLIYVPFLCRHHGNPLLRHRNVPLHPFQPVHGYSDHDAADDANVGLCGGNLRLCLSGTGNLLVQASLRAFVRHLGNHSLSNWPGVQHFPPGVVGQSIPRAQDHQQDGFHHVVFGPAGRNFLCTFVALAVLERGNETCRHYDHVDYRALYDTVLRGIDHASDEVSIRGEEEPQEHPKQPARKEEEGEGTVPE